MRNDFDRFYDSGDPAASTAPRLISSDRRGILVQEVRRDAGHTRVVLL